MKFNCSAAALYRYVEECDPALFRKIRDFVQQKRWDIVGGWEVQKEYDIVFATLSEYFEAVKDLPLETVKGELGPVFRGCYSNCHEVKRKIARATRRMLTAEKLGVKPEELSESWNELCFNHFHDILPGTSIREAFERGIFPGIGSVEHQADKLIDRQLFRRTAELDTMFMNEGGVYCWNPHPFEHKTIMSFDGFADPNRNGANFNVLRDKNGQEIPLQLLPPAPSFGPCGVAWGKLTAVIDLPPMGEKTFAYGVSEKKYPSVGFQKQRDKTFSSSFSRFKNFPIRFKRIEYSVMDSNVRQM